MSTPSTFLSCIDHGATKANWRELTDDWQPWDAIEPGAISARCLVCGSHLIIFAPAGAPASSPKEEASISQSPAGASFSGAGAAQGDGSHLTPESAVPAVFDDPDPTIRIPCLKAPN